MLAELPLLAGNCNPRLTRFRLQKVIGGDSLSSLKLFKLLTLQKGSKMAKLKTGDKVELVQPIIQGEVIKTEYDEESQDLKHLVEYLDANEESQQRWFNANELKAI